MVMQRPFRPGPFCCRSIRSMADDYISRATEEELANCERTQHMTRVAQIHARQQSCLESLISDDAVGRGGGIEPAMCNPDGTDLHPKVVIAEWKPAGFAMCRASQKMGTRGTWMAPRNFAVAKIHTMRVVLVFTTGEIALIGGPAEDLRAWGQFLEVVNGLQFTVGILLPPRLIDLEEMEFAHYSASGTFDSEQYGEVLADQRGVYAFGLFGIPSFLTTSMAGRKKPLVLLMIATDSHMRPTPLVSAN